MNRSIERRRFATSGARPEELILLNEFEHPGRGTVVCPAAPLVAARLSRAGARVHMDDIRGRGPVTGDDSLLTASYQDRKGNTVGLAVAVHSSDAAGHDRASAAIDEWLATLRTRRLVIAETDRLCRGEAATSRVVSGLLRRTPTDVHRVSAAPSGPLSGRDVGTTATLDDVPVGATVVFPAHGVPLAVRAEAAARGMDVVDTTCPLVRDAHAEIRRFADEGDQVVLVGRKTHGASWGFVGQAPENVTVVETPEDVEDLDLTGAAVSYVIQTGIALEDAQRVAAALRERYPRIRGTHPDGWCYAASDRAAAARTVAGLADLTLVLGEPTATDTALLCGFAGTAGPVQVLPRVPDLDLDRVRRAATLGLLPSFSAAPGTLDELISVVAGLGPLSIVRPHVQSEIMVQPGVLGPRPATARH